MLIKTLPVGHLETNCYVVTDENSLECAVIDPGAEANTILDYLEDNRLRCTAVMLTHAHFDHIGALDEVLRETGAVFYVNKKEEGGQLHGPAFKAPEGTVYYSDGDEVRVGSLVFRVMETPGHTPGGVTLICGDSGGDLKLELRSLKRIAELPGDYDVYPGHDMSTRLSAEREYNPYMRHAIEQL